MMIQLPDTYRMITKKGIYILEPDELKTNKKYSINIYDEDYNYLTTKYINQKPTVNNLIELIENYIKTI